MSNDSEIEELLRGWGDDGMLRAALQQAIEFYDGPLDNTIPALRAWLHRVDAQRVIERNKARAAAQ